MTDFKGAWRIVWMSGWDQDYVDKDVPGHFTFGQGEAVNFQFGMVQGRWIARPTEKAPRESIS